ncbi:hypothetical protein CYK16_09480 [Streptococcus oralis subsp. dentisani]|uniref:Uncharacterized protein n=1 Tax=Streptococcus oralis subsp. dentisani TaxID=1458253 RepID=A0A2I1UBZ4_STROR|nr:hypothetical protein CYK16_09480 [Streptococcus oralis subsp. dentisani]
MSRVSEKNHFPFNSIFLVGRTFVLPIFCQKVQLRCLFISFEVYLYCCSCFFDKIVIEIRKVEEKE